MASKLMSNLVEIPFERYVQPGIPFFTSPHFNTLRGFKNLRPKNLGNFNLLYFLKEMVWGGPRGQIHKNFEGRLKKWKRQGASK